MKIKVVSWNIWVNGNFDGIKEFLTTADADIIALQEVQANDPERDVIGFLTELGYQHVFAMTEHSWGGTDYKIGPALFTKLPVIDSGTFLINEKDARAAAWMDLRVNNKTIHVFSAHLLHAHLKPSTIQEAETTRFIEKLPDNQTIVLCDLNATPDSNAAQKMQNVLKDVDPTKTPTWSLYKEGCEVCQLSEVTVKLDYIFVSKDLQTSSFHVGDSNASDHLPILVNVEV